jgi:uncharacterized protein
MEANVVAVVGASPNRERYSNMAVRSLVERGYRVIPIHPSAAEIEGIPTKRAIGDLEPGVDTVSMYVNPATGLGMVDELARLNPGRVVLNPGAESEALVQRLEGAGLHVVCACTLVMLRIGTF